MIKKLLFALLTLTILYGCGVNKDRNDSYYLWGISLTESEDGYPNISNIDIKDNQMYVYGYFQKCNTENELYNPEIGETLTKMKLYVSDKTIYSSTGGEAGTMNISEHDFISLVKCHNGLGIEINVYNDQVVSADISS